MVEIVEVRKNPLSVLFLVVSLSVFVVMTVAGGVAGDRRSFITAERAE